MKEFQTKKGGRILYNEDFNNLQEIIESSTALFKSIGINFVISGCQKDSDGNVEGYVWLDNKIRKVEKTSIKNMLSPAIVSNDTTYTDTYEDGNQSAIIYDYGCKIIDLAKTSVASGKITWSSTTGFGNIFDSFISNFIVLKKSDNIQYVQKDVLFNGTAEIANAILRNAEINLVSTQLSDGSIKLTTNLNNSYWINITPDGDITFNRSAANGQSEIFFALTSKENTSKLSADIASVYHLNTKVLKTTTINGTDISDKVEGISNSLATTDWYNVIDRSNGQKVPALQCRLYNGVVHIQGTLPQYFCHKSRLSDYQNYKISDYGLPDEMLLPETDVEFDVISPQMGGVGVTVHIMRDEPYAGRFYFDTNAFPTNDDTTISAKYEFSYPFAPYVSWQYIPKFNYQNIYSVNTTEEFVAYTWNGNYNKFIAYNKLTQVLINQKTGRTYRTISWQEAIFVGSVHQGDNPGNYCSTSAYKNSDGTYDTSCATGTLYFRSALTPNKLYSETWFSGSDPILAGKSVQLGYDCYVTIQRTTNSFRVNNNTISSFTPSTDRIAIHCGYKDIQVISKPATDDNPPLYMEVVETAKDFTITSGANLLTLVSNNGTGSRLYSVSDFTGTRQITISFPDKTFTFQIQKQ